MWTVTNPDNTVAILPHARKGAIPGIGGGRKLHGQASSGVLCMFPKMVRRDVIVLLLCKAAALTLIYFLFIAPMTRPEPDARATAAHLIGG